MGDIHVNVDKGTVKSGSAPGELDDFGRAKQAMREAGNKLVTRPIGRIDNGIIKRKGHSNGGREKKFTPVRMVNGINRYFAHCEKNDDIPTIKGMMIFNKLYPETFYKYLKHPEFQEIMEWARFLIKNWAEIDVYNTPGQAAGKIAYMKNIHDWSEKVSTENKTEVKQVMSKEQATSVIEGLAPLLLEVLQKDQKVVEQLGVQDAEFEEKGNG